MGRKMHMAMMMTPDTIRAVVGVWFFGWSFPNLAGRFPSLPMANETLDTEKTIELTAAIEPMMMPNAISPPPI